MRDSMLMNAGVFFFYLARQARAGVVQVEAVINPNLYED